MLQSKYCANLNVLAKIEGPTSAVCSIDIQCGAVTPREIVSNIFTKDTP